MGKDHPYLRTTLGGDVAREGRPLGVGLAPPTWESKKVPTYRTCAGDLPLPKSTGERRALQYEK